MKLQINRMLILSGGIALIFGARLPWISVPVLFGVLGTAFEAIEIGWEDNGLITGSIGFILLIMGLFWKARAGKWYSIAGTFLAALAVLVVLGCFKRILEINPAEGFFAATDAGIYITLIGALLALAGTVYRNPIQQKAPDTKLASDAF